ncbi:hypothetical protein P2318_32250 [Myxococcaceae bacterium GXIMD 01537]
MRARRGLSAGGLALLALLSGCGEQRERSGDPSAATLTQPREESARTLDLGDLPEGCVLERECGRYVSVDCGAAVDGPAYFVERASQRIVAYCGGACMGGPQPGLCERCSPADWGCPAQ